MPSKRITVSLKQTTFDKMKDVMRTTGMNQSQIISEALRSYISRLPPWTIIFSKREDSDLLKVDVCGEINHIEAGRLEQISTITKMETSLLVTGRGAIDLNVILREIDHFPLRDFKSTKTHQLRNGVEMTVRSHVSTVDASDVRAFLQQVSGSFLQLQETLDKKKSLLPLTLLISPSNR